MTRMLFEKLENLEERCKSLSAPQVSPEKLAQLEAAAGALRASEKG